MKVGRPLSHLDPPPSAPGRVSVPFFHGVLLSSLLHRPCQQSLPRPFQKVSLTEQALTTNSQALILNTLDFWDGAWYSYGPRSSGGVALVSTLKNELGLVG